MSSKLQAAEKTYPRRTRIWQPEAGPSSAPMEKVAPTQLVEGYNLVPTPRTGTMSEGGDKSEQHAHNVDRLTSNLERLRCERRPLPANPRRPNDVSMTYVAQEAGIYKEALLRARSEMRTMVEGAAVVLGIAVAIGNPGDGPLTWQKLLDRAIAERRRQNEDYGAPSDHAVPRLRKVFYAAAKLDKAGMSADASDVLSAAKKCLERSGQLTKVKSAREEIEFAEYCSARHEASNGLPDDFAGALSVACKRLGLTIASLARNVGAKPQTVVNWSAGRKVPDPRMHLIVERIERRLGLHPGELSSKIRRNRLGAGRLPIGLFPLDLRDRKNERFRSKMAALLPADILFRAPAEQNRLVREARELVDQANAKGKKRGPNYGLHKWPEHLNDEWTDLKRHKARIILKSGISNASIWTAGGAKKWHDHFSQPFGFALTPAAEQFQVNLDDLSFALFANPLFALAAVRNKAERTRDSDDRQNISHTDVDLFTLCASMFSEGGWARCSATIRAKCGFSRSGDAKWREYCDKIEARYKSHEKIFRHHARIRERQLIRHTSVLPILNMPEPLTAIRILAQGLERDLQTIKGDIQRAKLLQDLVYVLIQAQVAFRPGTTVALTYRKDGRGHLRQDKDGSWHLNVPKQLFKNRLGAALKSDFARPLEDSWGLYKYLEQFLSDGRFVLLDGIRTDALFVYSRGAVKREALMTETDELKERDNRRELALAGRVRAFTARYLGWNPRTNTGIEGIAAFSPTGFRHILATSIIKRTSNFQLAADAIADCEEVVRKYYAKWLPSDRVNDLHKAISESLHCADQTAATTKVAAQVKKSLPRTASVGSSPRPYGKKAVLRVDRRTNYRKLDPLASQDESVDARG